MTTKNVYTIIVMKTRIKHNNVNCRHGFHFTIINNDPSAFYLWCEKTNAEFRSILPRENESYDAKCIVYYHGLCKSW